MNKADQAYEDTLLIWAIYIFYIISEENGQLEVTLDTGCKK